MYMHVHVHVYTCELLVVEYGVEVGAIGCGVEPHTPQCYARGSLHVHNMYVPAGHPGMCRLCVMMKIQFSL